MQKMGGRRLENLFGSRGVMFFSCSALLIVLPFFIIFVIFYLLRQFSA
jgi:hypothetical protein